MSEVFPFLCEGEIPQGPHVREVTRFCLSPRLRSRDRLRVRNRLVDGMIRHALRAKVTSLIGLSEMGFLSQILSAGWQCDPLGFPQVVRSEEHTSELQSLMRTSYADFCLKKTNTLH